ncbi:hypothetical protein [Nocardia arthritidis]|uniref:Uncharacterized protein n=1 Tax=Nocardia arthritidis TaxID=228602 RepID=A0A6G9Y974_9NOCA|nr:hypothetical protein [Nocardia arthritidis]QIS09670.1 hypothetical protein F5544_08840 [Nocardia arthritidis]
MQTVMSGRRFIAAVLVAAAGTAGFGAGIAAAQPPTAAVRAVDAVQPQFQFTATFYATVSCYFENLDRTDATGPFQFNGTGRTKDAAVNDAKNKAQAAVPSGKKLKHCRTVNVTSRR